MIIAGVDEVGRGPLAGAVVAAAVILGEPIVGVRDSKKLSPVKRRFFSELIQSNARCYAYGRAEVNEIDALNIHHATLLAMKRAIEGLSITPSHVMVDGLYVPDVSMSCEAIVKGDDLIDSIAAASILAKVLRDDEMTALDEVYPGYGFSRHKGYPTAEHLAAIARLGVLPIHRRSYGPVNRALLHGAVGLNGMVACVL